MSLFEQTIDFQFNRRERLSQLDNISLIKHLSVHLPLAMSIAALALFVGHAAIFGVLQEADEGTAAHIWQILMAAQLPNSGLLYAQVVTEAARRIFSSAYAAGWYLARQSSRRALAHLAYELTHRCPRCAQGMGCHPSLKPMYFLCD
jgi:hypothetical protein